MSWKKRSSLYIGLLTVKDKDTFFSKNNRQKKNQLLLIMGVFFSGHPALQMFPYFYVNLFDCSIPNFCRILSDFVCYGIMELVHWKCSLDSHFFVYYYNHADHHRYDGKIIQWKPYITGMVGPEQKSCYSRSLRHPKSRETRTD